MTCEHFDTTKIPHYLVDAANWQCPRCFEIIAPKRPSTRVIKKNEKAIVYARKMAQAAAREERFLAAMAERA